MSDTTRLPTAEELQSHSSFLKRLAHSLVRDEHLAEDIAQDAVVAYLEKPPSDATRLRGWMTGVARNVLRMRARSAARREAREQRVARAEVVPSQTDSLERFEIRSKVAGAVRDLGEPYQSTVVLRYFEDLSPQEISNRLEIPLQTVYTRLRRAHEHLQASLDDRHGGRRSAWVVALIPMLGSDRAPPVAGTAMSATKVVTLVTIAATLLVGFSWIVFSPWSSGDPRPAGPGAENPVPRDGRPLVAESLPDRAGPGFFLARGIVLRDGMPRPAVVEAHALEDSPRFGVGSAPDRGGMASPFRTAPLVARSRAGRDGRFMLRGLPAGSYRLVATDGDGAVGRGRLVVEGDFAEGRGAESIPEPVPQTVLRIVSGRHDLAGRATYADGRPFRGLVWALPSESGGAPFGGPAIPVRTDETGTFLVSGLTAGFQDVHFLAPGSLQCRVRNVEVPTLRGLVVTVDGGLRKVTGTVVDDRTGRPVANACVHGGGPGANGESILWVRTDAPGHFATRLSEGSRAVVATATGYGRGRSLISPDRPLEIRLPPLAVLSGRVLARGTREPVPGVVVHAGPGRTTSDASGRYSFELPGDDSVPVVAGGANHVSERRTAHLTAGETLELDLEVGPAGTVGGVVSDESGSPVSGAVVAACFSGSGDGFPAPVPVASDARGRFTIRNLIPGARYEVGAWSPDGGRGHFGPVTTAAGETSELAIRIDAPRWAAVEVRNEGNGPVAGLRIEAYPSFRYGRRLGLVACTDSAGTARIGPLPPGEVWVLARHPEFAFSPEKKLLPSAGARRDPLVIRVVPRRAISGRVALEDGTDVPPGQVEVTLRRWPRGIGSRVALRLSPKGAFRATGLAPGRYELVVRTTPFAEGHEVVTRVVQAGDEGLVVRVRAGSLSSPPVELTVRASGPDGQPVAKASVWTFGATRVHHAGQLENGGTVLRFPAGDGEVHIVVSSVEDATGRPVGGGVFGPFPVRTGEILLELPEPRSLEGEVLDEEGRPLAGARVSVAPVVAPADRIRIRYASITTRTDSDGRFRVDGLGESDYVVFVEDEAGRSVRLESPVPAGTSSVTLRLDPCISAVIRVLDPDGVPVPGARVELRRTGQMRALPSVETDEAGRARLQGLDPASRYRLAVLPPEELPELRQLWRPYWAPADGQVTLDRVYTVAGLITDPAGTPLEHVQVWVRPGAATREVPWSPTGRVTEGGRFVLREITSPTLALRATVTGGDPDEPGLDTVEVIGGSTDVALIVEPGLEQEIRVSDGWPPRVAVCAGLYSGGTYRVGCRLQSDGFRFYGLEANTTYQLRILSQSPEGGFAHCSELQPGTTPIEVSLEKGKTLRGSVRLPARTRTCVVEAHLPGIHVRGEADAEGRFELHGLVDATYRVRARADTSAGRWEGEATGRPGEEMDLGLTYRKRLPTGR